MKAAVYTGYGPADVIAVAYVQKPTPGPDEVLIKVRAGRLIHVQPTRT